MTPSLIKIVFSYEVERREDNGLLSHSSLTTAVSLNNPLSNLATCSLFDTSISIACGLIIFECELDETSADFFSVASTDDIIFECELDESSADIFSVASTCCVEKY